ncbi:PqqD family protein [Oceanisphaera pacifica]|uniref:PqqD family peptide modification chaperone n=1 Tax=Oceanisphaera pacifica TaxID=2818389 RepID=A0ABS3NCA9_9GAMM|nr:PqqD family protein [Oceanisphaera pacifica]MBO1518165.1 PqqD family peptide modification chaperone [Oceanisphaera pacifica]
MSLSAFDLLDNNVVDISLPGIGDCLRVEHAPEVVEALEQAMPGWPITVTAAQGKIPQRYIYQDTEGLWQGAYNIDREYHLPSPASAACSLVGDLISQRLAGAPELLGLHCGSVEINGQLVLFPESSKAGKSTLTVAFSAAGYRVFGDDVLGLTAQGEGVAMGVAPRLRLPLPESFSAELVDYATRFAGPEDERYRFVIPPKNGLAQYNDSSSVGAIVLLDRDAGATSPEVVTLSPGEGLLQLLCQNFAHDAASETLFDHLLPLMQNVPCLLLRYSEPLAGARYLANAIKEKATPNTSQASLLSAPARYPTDAQPVPTLGPLFSEDKKAQQYALQSQWTPQQGISSYPLGEELFLIHNSTGAIHRLNSSGKVVWLLLQQSTLSGHALTHLIADYFHVSVNDVTHDISALIRVLADAGLINLAP